MECVNCPGATDHSTADCPMVRECCKPTEEELRLLNEGQYTPEELWGVDGKPSCPKCARKQPQASAAQSAPVGMTAERAAYFMRRFKHEEKLLGPNEQAAIDYVLAMLVAQSAPAGEREAFEHLWATRNSGDDGVIGDRPLRSLADPERYRGSAVNGSFVWFQRGASWQRTQSAGCRRGWQEELNLIRAVLEGYTPSIVRNDALRAVKKLAAAPAQPAAQDEFGDAYQGAREDLAIWKRRALEAEEKVRKAEQSTPAAIEVIGYASPGQVEILRSLPRTGGMKVKGCKDGRYTEPVVLLSAARAALFAAVIRCEQTGAFKTCMECGYQDGHDEICKFHERNRAAHDQGECFAVDAARAALSTWRQAQESDPCKK